jgi:8-oxo-dGTP pyrophosphatase MutT (NUDIX family)
MKSRNEISAGGVVYRQNAAGLDVLIAKDAGYHKWVLPKGLVRKNESYEQTALREVEEEVGVRARVVAPLGEPEKYIYTARGMRVFKSVYYFLMEYESGSETQHDSEMEDVRWVPIDEAIELMGYKAAKDVLVRSKALLSGLPHTT